MNQQSVLSPIRPSTAPTHLRLQCVILISRNVHQAGFSHDSAGQLYFLSAIDTKQKVMKVGGDIYRAALGPCAHFCVIGR